MNESIESPFLYKRVLWWTLSSPEKRVSNSQSRIFWILSWNTERRPWEVWLYSSFAFRAHMGVDWKEWKHRKTQEYLRQQLFWWRAMEVLICEEMITQHPGFHFLPTQEMDLNYKTDIISRLPYRGASRLRWHTKLKTLAIGTQLTLLEIPENITWTYREDQMRKKKYRDKVEQVRIMASFLQNPITRKSIKQRFGKLNLPDILSFIAVNGELRKVLWNSSNYTLQKFNEWKDTWFESDQLLDHFKKWLREKVKDVALFIAWSQEYILSEEFLFIQKAAKGKSYKKTYGNCISVEFSDNDKELKIRLKDLENDDIMVYATYFLVGNTMKKLASKARRNKRTISPLVKSSNNRKESEKI